MPYKVEHRGTKWVVVRADTGEKVAEHLTKDLAQKQIVLLNMHEHGVPIR